MNEDKGFYWHDTDEDTTVMMKLSVMHKFLGGLHNAYTKAPSDISFEDSFVLSIGMLVKMSGDGDVHLFSENSDGEPKIHDTNGDCCGNQWVEDE